MSTTQLFDQLLSQIACTEMGKVDKKSVKVSKGKKKSRRKVTRASTQNSKSKSTKKFKVTDTLVNEELDDVTDADESTKQDDNSITPTPTSSITAAAKVDDDKNMPTPAPPTATITQDSSEKVYVCDEKNCQFWTAEPEIFHKHKVESELLRRYHCSHCRISSNKRFDIIRHLVSKTNNQHGPACVLLSEEFGVYGYYKYLHLRADKSAVWDKDSVTGNDSFLQTSSPSSTSPTTSARVSDRKRKIKEQIYPSELPNNTITGSSPPGAKRIVPVELSGEDMEFIMFQQSELMKITQAKELEMVAANLAKKQAKADADAKAKANKSIEKSAKTKTETTKPIAKTYKATEAKTETIKPIAKTYKATEAKTETTKPIGKTYKATEAKTETTKPIAKTYKATEAKITPKTLLLQPPVNTNAKDDASDNDSNPSVIPTSPKETIAQPIPLNRVPIPAMTSPPEVVLTRAKVVTKTYTRKVGTRTNIRNESSIGQQQANSHTDKKSETSPTNHPNSYVWRCTKCNMSNAKSTYVTDHIRRDHRRQPTASVDCATNDNKTILYEKVPVSYGGDLPVIHSSARPPGLIRCYGEKNQKSETNEVRRKQQIPSTSKALELPQVPLKREVPLELESLAAGSSIVPSKKQREMTNDDIEVIESGHFLKPTAPAPKRSRSKKSIPVLIFSVNTQKSHNPMPESIPAVAVAWKGWDHDYCDVPTAFQNESMPAQVSNSAEINEDHSDDRNIDGLVVSFMEDSQPVMNSLTTELDIEELPSRREESGDPVEVEMEIEIICSDSDDEEKVYSKENEQHIDNEGDSDNDISNRSFGSGSATTLSASNSEHEQETGNDSQDDTMASLLEDSINYSTRSDHEQRDITLELEVKKSSSELQNQPETDEASSSSENQPSSSSAYQNDKASIVPLLSYVNKDEPDELVSEIFNQSEVMEVMEEVMAQLDFHCPDASPQTVDSCVVDNDKQPVVSLPDDPEIKMTMPVPDISEVDLVLEPEPDRFEGGNHECSNTYDLSSIPTESSTISKLSKADNSDIKDKETKSEGLVDKLDLGSEHSDDNHKFDTTTVNQEESSLLATVTELSNDTKLNNTETKENNSSVLEGEPILEQGPGPSKPKPVTTVLDFDDSSISSFGSEDDSEEGNGHDDSESDSYICPDERYWNGFLHSVWKNRHDRNLGVTDMFRIYHEGGKR